MAGLSRTALLHGNLVTLCSIRCSNSWSHDTASATPPSLTLTRFSLFPFRSPLLRESRLLSFPRGTEMFQFPRFPPSVLCVQTEVTPHDGCWVSPFGHLRINAQSTAPRSFSQSLTSFIGSWRQGIHRWLFVAWKNKDARACSTVLKGQRHDGGTSRDAQRTVGRSGAVAHAFDVEGPKDRRPQNRREDQVDREATA
jgi:hypothetical protein